MTQILKDAFRKFTTSVAFITSKGKNGPNVMAAEWTYVVSHYPFLVSVHLKPEDATFDAISESGVFGVGLVSEDQVAAMSLAGHFSKHETNKLSSELFETYPAKTIDAPMIRGCALSLECKLVQSIPMGDHTAFVGEVQEFSIDPSKNPIAYHGGAFRLDSRIERAASIGVAATPSNVKPGDHVLVEGELTCAERAGREVRVTIESATGKTVASSPVQTDDQGFFTLEMMLPADAEKGSHKVVARHEGTEGRAKLSVN